MSLERIKKYDAQRLGNVKPKEEVVEEKPKKKKAKSKTAPKMNSSS